MKKLLIVIHSLSGGGAERVVTRLLGQISQTRPDIELSLALFKPTLDYPVPDGVKLHIIGRKRTSLPSKIWEQFIVFRNLRALLASTKPDAVLSFMPAANMFSLAAKKSLNLANTRFVVSERVAIESNYSGFKRKVLGALMRALYPSADNVLCVAEGIKQEIERMGIPLKAITVVNNAVEAEDLKIKALAREPHSWTLDASQPLLITAGRLTHQKGHDTFLSALKVLSDKGLYPRTLIYGTGELASALQTQIDEAGLTETVLLTGFNPNPYPDIAKAACFVFPSRWEGFPNALLEAMALEVPVISADCPFGPKELILNDVYGKLVPVDEPELLANAIEALLSTYKDPSLYLAEKEKSKQGALRYTPENMLKAYLSVLIDE